MAVKIWFQLVSSRKRLPDFLDTLQRQCDEVAAPGTTVHVRGTPNGALGDHYASFLHHDADEILRLLHTEVVGGGYGVYALANSLDPALDALREQLEVPVLSVMQVGCSLAPMLGDRFGLIVPNDKFVPKYRDIVEGYGMSSKLADISPLAFDRISDHNAMFVDDEAAARTYARIEACAAELAGRGAEVIMVAGITASLLRKLDVREMHGARVLDMYSSLVKVSEAMGYLAEHCGMTTSRMRRYRVPPADLMREAVQTYKLDDPGALR
ncbi:aspartate/glutamate racemase family protein [Streptomyces sp. E5N91]|uniref:aspartate/glutamate racemase family protein n=1 Tax=Streptomyces sp. E5N91 TaxID=1851996 RepID=UPI00187D2916|nr:aspartate/glutamate racemase family protein [Streptomyces sp. E5N91]